MKKITGLVLSLLSSPLWASDFMALSEALPQGVDISRTQPVFDFDGDGCLPSAGISRLGQQNPGLKPTGRLGGNCRAGNFMDTSNTLHRHACIEQAGIDYCGHFYALYFKKDQVIDFFGGGHRHDWEHVAVWTQNGVITHGSYSAHGDLYTRPANELPFEGTHPKFVYHKDGILTHAMRFAKSNEVAENGYGRFVTPAIVSWYELTGDGTDNQAMRNRLNAFDYGSATIPLKDSNFRTNLNRFRPSDYPEFTQASLEASQYQ